jgi:hypothetical protein
MKSIIHIMLFRCYMFLGEVDTLISMNLPHKNMFLERSANPPRC